MCKILIFGGTTEGRELSDFCIKNKIKAYVSVVTEYGAELLENNDCIKILKGRMDNTQISSFLKSHCISLVIDATHPYAVLVTQNIKSACNENEIKYFRVIREKNDAAYNNYFNDIKSAAKYLCQTSGKILITTGSKELHEFCCIENYASRCVVRILPIDNVISDSSKLGFKREDIIAKKGPFSKTQNIEDIKKYNIRFLITKESGQIGGFNEKRLAAEDCGVDLIVIKRPEENGISILQMQKILLENVNGK